MKGLIRSFESAPKRSVFSSDFSFIFLENINFQYLTSIIRIKISFFDLNLLITNYEKDSYGNS